MFLVRWIWSTPPQGTSLIFDEAGEFDPEEVIEEFVFVKDESEKVTRRDVLKMYDKLPQISGRNISMTASICCVSDAEKMFKIFQDTNLEPQRAPQLSIDEEGPYELAIWSQVQKTKRTFSRVHHFIDSSILGVRGSSAGSDRIMFLTGKEASFSVQALKDISRWSQQTHLTFQGDVFCLGSQASTNKIAIGIGNYVIPINIVNLLEKIQLVLKSDTCFENFSKFFNQGPMNDMIYRMMADIYQRWNVSLFPSKKMERFFHLSADLSEENGKVMAKIIITVRGYFDGGSIQDRGFIEPKEGQVLGSFEGTTVINLSNGSGLVRTHIEVFPDVWDKLLNV